MNKKVVIVFFVLSIFFVFSCKSKNLNRDLDKISIGNSVYISIILKRDFDKLMIVSSIDRENIISANCKKVIFSQPYESWDFVILCIDSKYNGYVYVINPFFGWLDSVDIKSEIEENIFFDFKGIGIRRNAKNKFVLTKY